MSKAILSTVFASLLIASQIVGGLYLSSQKATEEIASADLDQTCLPSSFCYGPGIDPGGASSS